jgi:hypothetical protein
MRKDDNFNENENETEDDAVFLNSMLDTTDVDDEVNEDVKTDVAEQETPEVSYRLIGKHSLRHDPFFGGKRQKKEDDEPDTYEPDMSSLSIDPSSSDYEESNDSYGNYRIRQLRESVYNAVVNNTDIDINTPRRKPSKLDFNRYFNAVKRAIGKDMFSEAEIFVELAPYFSDNLFNMFKLLDTKIANRIIIDLKNKYGAMSALQDLDFQ